LLCSSEAVKKIIKNESSVYILPPANIYNLCVINTELRTKQNEQYLKLYNLFMMKTTTKLLSLLIGILIITNSCSMFEDDEDDYYYKIDVSNVQVFKEGLNVKITWKDPVDDNFLKVVIIYNRIIGDWDPLESGIDIEPGIEEAIFEGYSDQQDYKFVVKACNKSNICSKGIEVIYNPSN